MDSAVFYGGYGALVDTPTPTHLIRLKNSLITTKITQDVIDNLGDELNIEIALTAL